MKAAVSDPRLAEVYRSAQCVFFDCDGIIFDSNPFKQRAMRHALHGHSERELGDMTTYWRSNGGLSRFVKLEHFFTHIAPQADVQRCVREAAARFGEYSRAAYDEVEPIAQALELARAAGPERCYVVSGAAQSELQSVFSSKGIAGYFSSILGSPRPKQALVELVLSDCGCSPTQALLIGDGAADFRVCRALGMHFVFLEQFSEWTHARSELAAAEPVSHASNWEQLLTALTR